MFTSRLHGVLASVGAALILSGTPSESHAIFHWFGCCSKGETYAAYPPVVAQPQCCNYQPQVCNYQPQTCYRTAYVNVPVVSYRPVSSCDPCTGCPTTVLRPVTSYVTQARMVPYTSYRPVYSNGCCTPLTASYAPAPVSYSPAPACCGASAAPASYTSPTYTGPTYTSPSSTYVSPSTVSPGTTIRSVAPNGNTTPSLRSDSSAPLDNGGTVVPLQPLRTQPAPIEQESRLRGTMPNPIGGGSGSLLLPRRYYPADRTTSRPLPSRTTYRPVAIKQASLTNEAQEADWKPAN